MVNFLVSSYALWATADEWDFLWGAWLGGDRQDPVQRC